MVVFSPYARFRLPDIPTHIQEIQIADLLDGIRRVTADELPHFRSGGLRDASNSKSFSCWMVIAVRRNWMGGELCSVMHCPVKRT